MTILPSLCRICYVPASSLPFDVAERFLAGLSVAVYSDVVEVPFVGFPSCESTEEYQNNGTVHKTQLKFVSTEQLPTRQHLAFIVSDVNGNDFLIGTQEKPYPIVKVKRTTGDDDSHAGFDYEVSLTSIAGLIPCTI